METAAKALLALAAISFVIGVLMGVTHSDLMGIPPESFSRATNDLALLAIAMILLERRQ